MTWKQIDIKELTYIVPRISKVLNKNLLNKRTSQKVDFNK